MIEASFADVSVSATEQQPSEEAKTACREAITKTQEFLAQVAERDGARDRSGPLALLELELRARKMGVSSGACPISHAYDGQSVWGGH